MLTTSASCHSPLDRRVLIVLRSCSYLAEDWVTAVLHDGFSNFIGECRAALTLDQGTTDILNKLKDTVEQTEDDIYVASVINDCVGDGGGALPESTQRILDNLLVEFLRRHKQTLGGHYDLSLLGTSAPTTQNMNLA